MSTFGLLLREYRLLARLGLRTFASLINDRASVVSAVESGRRAPWREENKIREICAVLGLVESSEKYHNFFRSSELADANPTQISGKVLWWWTAEDSSAINANQIQEMSEFISNTASAIEINHEAFGTTENYSYLTELEIEGRVRNLLGKYDSSRSVAPVDIESILENNKHIRLEIIAGLIPRYSVMACLLRASEQITLVVDRIVADSRPMSTYRDLLAQSYAPTELRESRVLPENATWFWDLQCSESWPMFRRDCRRFSQAVLLPVTPLLKAADTAYAEMIQQLGWVEIEEAACWIRNRLAEQFAVPTRLVHRRLRGWPCHLYGRIAQAIAAEELSLPAADWIALTSQKYQQLLFELESEN